MATAQASIEFAYVVNAIQAQAEGLSCRENFVERMLRNLNKVFTKNRSERGVLIIIFEAIANELCEMLTRINDAILQLNIMTANGKFLDLWGQYFGEFRYPNEEDARYRGRLLAVLEQPKTTLGVLRKVIRPYFVEEPEIRELMIDGIDPASVVFPPGSVVDWIRRRSRIEIIFKQPKPPVTGIYTNVFFVTDDTKTITIPARQLHTFVGRDGIESEVTPLEGFQAYVFNPRKVGLQDIDFEDFKDIVDDVKAAGVRVYYKSGSEYLL